VAMNAFKTKQAKIYIPIDYDTRDKWRKLSFVEFQLSPWANNYGKSLSDSL
jgi:hypothetical protein